MPAPPGEADACSVSAPIVARTTEPGWEEAVLMALWRGEPFAVACHDDPLPTIRAFAAERHGQGTPIPKAKRRAAARAVRQARAEGHTLRDIGQLLGSTAPDLATNAAKDLMRRGDT